jgi:hypothetical protein
VPESRSTSHRPGTAASETALSVVRTAAAAALVLIGIVWMVVYLNVAPDSASMSWMADLGRWNFLIGFGLVFLGLSVAAHPSTPLGRGRGVVVGMLACFLIGLLWIVLYYIAGSTYSIPLLRDLGQYNLVVGIGFMAVGFVYATRWE